VNTNVNGSAIITHNNCTVVINAIVVYDSTETTVMDHWNIFLPISEKLTINRKMQVVTLNGLHMQSMDLKNTITTEQYFQKPTQLLTASRVY